jgi:hypothetical protein
MLLHLRYPPQIPRTCLWRTLSERPSTFVLLSRPPLLLIFANDRLRSLARKAAGPMPLQRYMTLCLSHPTLGYYTRGDVFGNKGDFITSPEISQVFGEVRRFLSPWSSSRSLADLDLGLRL